MARKRIAPRMAAAQGVHVSAVDDNDVLRVGWSDEYASFAARCGEVPLVRRKEDLLGSTTMATRARRRVGFRPLLLLRITRGCCQCGVFVLDAQPVAGDEEEDARGAVVPLTPPKLAKGERMAITDSFTTKQRHFYENRNLLYCKQCEPTSYYACRW